MVFIMGIPSYFSHVIRNYPTIIKNLNAMISDDVNITTLYMDCNSVIYDAVRDTELLDVDSGVYEMTIIEKVIEKITAYMELLKPSQIAYIAFDGVAPYAKMEQQRTRRYKSQFSLSIQEGSCEKKQWNTSAITPGTKFMNLLSSTINTYFKRNNKYAFEIIISGSDEVGEGEHKLFDHLRNSYKQSPNQSIALYGLDADLIMLSIFNLPYTKNIYVFREAPEFIKSYIPVETQEGNESNLYFLDINSFGEKLLVEMGCEYKSREQIYDYVFLCFFLGNDFLPHFPSMNIRTHGIDTLLNIYRKKIGNNPNKNIIVGGKIQWGQVRIILQEIVSLEKDFLLNEYRIRKKFDNWDWSKYDKTDLISNTPVVYRLVEKYIDPTEYGWENRYYKGLIDENFYDKLDENMNDLCINYLEGLEWVFKYYTCGCPDWKWKYHYHYPPLFKDLVKYVPSFETDFLKPSKKNRAFLPETQLSYVLPYEQLELLPENIQGFLKTNHRELYPTKYDFQWAFCRYFWESKPILPEIPLKQLETWDIQYGLVNG